MNFIQQIQLQKMVLKLAGLNIIHVTSLPPHCFVQSIHFFMSAHLARHNWLRLTPCSALSFSFN